MLFADRVLPSTPPEAWFGWRVLRSRRKVAEEGFALFTLDTLMGALVAADAIELRLEQRRGMLKSYEVAHLRLLPGVRARLFPHRSPEARVIDWLARREARTGWLDEAITGTLIPEQTPHPARSWNHELHRGLAARRLAQEVTKPFLLFFTTKSHELLPEAAQALARVPDAELASAIACRERLAPHERERCRQAWTHATQLRYLDTSA